MLSIPLVLVAVFIFAIGIVTLGLGFALYGLMPAISVVWALFYYGATLGGPASATLIGVNRSARDAAAAAADLLASTT